MRISLIIIFFIGLLARAQNLPAVDIVSESGFIVNDANSELGIEGSVYLNESWDTVAEVITPEDKSYSIKAINYNVKLETFVVKSEEGKLLTLNKEKVKYIKYNSSIFEIIGGKYFEQFSKGEINIFKSYYLVTISGAIDPMTKDKLTNDKYAIKSKLHLMEGDDLIEFKPTKKNIFKLFSKEKASMVKSHMKKQNLSIRDEDELKQILNYYSTLK